MADIAFNNVSFTLMTCPECGLMYGVPEPWRLERKGNGLTWYCPNGHTRYYVQGETELAKANRLKREMELQLQARINEEQHLRLVVEKERDSERRKRRKIEKRIAAGVCPCCNRTFDDLHRHMQTKHKDYALPPGKHKEIAGTIQ